MTEVNFELKGEYIELMQLLKALDIAQTGGHAKMIVDEGEIERDGEIETRRRAKIRKDEVIIVGNQIKITII